MKLSTRGRYGILAMFDLAARVDEGPVSIKSIAERRDISEAYLEQLIAVLKRAELVTSTRGAQGGYALSRPAAEITVGQVLRALEGSLNLVSCVGGEEVCGRACDCPSRIVYQKISDGLNQVADSITLDDMVNDYERACAGGNDT